MSDKKDSLVLQIRNILKISLNCDGILTMPTLLISDVENSKLKSKPAADKAIDYFNEAGFDCDRSRMNLYGYPGLLRNLAEPPPWIHVEMEDVIGEVSSVRNAELRTLLDYIHSTDAALLDDLFITDWRQNFEAIYRQSSITECVAPLSDESKEFMEVEAHKSFSRLVNFGTAMTNQEFCSIWGAIFDFDEFALYPGVPDLLVWISNSSVSFWFFVEVKAHGDYLSRKQKEWLRSNWNLVCGHYLLLLIE